METQDGKFLNQQNRVKSAFPMKSKLSEDAENTSGCASCACCKNHFVESRRAKTAYVQRSQTPEDQDAVETEETVELPSTFNEARKLFGWKFELPNDPFNLRRHYLNVRPTYTVRMTESSVLPNAPKLHSYNRDTYFYSTFSTKPRTFDISPDFSSEVYNRKREELRKKGEWNYRTRDFAFMY